MKRTIAKTLGKLIERIAAAFYEALDAFVRHLGGEKVSIHRSRIILRHRSWVIANTATESLKTGKPIKIQYPAKVGL